MISFTKEPLAQPELGQTIPMKRKDRTTKKRKNIFSTIFITQPRFEYFF